MRLDGFIFASVCLHIFAVFVQNHIFTSPKGWRNPSLIIFCIVVALTVGFQTAHGKLLVLSGRTRVYRCETSRLWSACKRQKCVKRAESQPSRSIVLFSSLTKTPRHLMFIWKVNADFWDCTLSQTHNSELWWQMAELWTTPLSSRFLNAYTVGLLILVTLYALW